MASSPYGSDTRNTEPAGGEVPISKAVANSVGVSIAGRTTGKDIVLSTCTLP